MRQSPLADVTRTRGKLDHLQARLARIRASLAPAAEAESLALSNAAARIGERRDVQRKIPSVVAGAGWQRAAVCCAGARAVRPQCCGAALCSKKRHAGEVRSANRSSGMRLRQEAGIEPKQNGVRHTAGPTAGRSRCVQRAIPTQRFRRVQTNEPQCGCPQGWTWNKGGKACMTVGDRQREAGMACASQFPGSVASKVNLKNEDCGCPSGTTWDGPGKKRCIPSTAQQRPTRRCRRRPICVSPSTVFHSALKGRSAI